MSWFCKSQELRSYDQQLPCWTAELVAAEAYAEQLEDEAKMAHAEHAEHTRKLTEINPLSPASSEGDRDHAAAVEHYAQMGIDHRHFDDPLIPFAGLSDEEIHKRHVESMMQKEIARREVSIAHLRRQHLYAANESIASSKQEAEELREALAKAEREGRQLTEERQAAEEQELPLREWVKHIEDQVHAARLENARLSASLSSALAFRASLLPDEDAAPVGPESHTDIQQVRWLRDHQQQCLSRKARLKEEIAEEEQRRAAFLHEAAVPLQRNHRI
ncbi:unnamed protein product [Durusdinium trenchii]|uniref:Uncharacterized protein n=1 Tax=Durusdinium trenchii TaxID=1381693 RepID=A0ABP0JL71_9DINO